MRAAATGTAAAAAARAAARRRAADRRGRAPAVAAAAAARLPLTRHRLRTSQVINLAAICNPSEYIKQPVNTINSNFTDAQDCINFCVEHDKHLIHFSTCEIYGRTQLELRPPRR